MDVRLLQRVLSQPTAPFRECHVIRVVTDHLAVNGVPHFRDPVGNVVVGAASEEQYRRLLRDPGEPVFLFIAHMDHPGFHGVKWLGKDLLAVKWFGGSPTKLMLGAKVWIGDAGGLRGEGRFTQVKPAKHGRGIESGRVRVTGLNRDDAADPTTLFGAFRFRKPLWKVGDRIYTKAADDLVGVTAIVSLAVEWTRNPGPATGPAFLGVLTRAEEVGFIGAIGHLELGWLAARTRPVYCVSLETSRTLPGAVFGKGPVVRMGDRATTFDPGCLHLFTRVAQEALGKRFQRRVMDGGTCEGTVCTAYGFPTLAISVPLGNYHNESFEGGPDSRGKLGPGPEFVHLSDVKGMYRLCEALLQPGRPWESPWRERVAQFQESHRQARSLLALS